MEQGSSLRWQDTLHLAIGQDRLDASAVRDFFRPLEEWLRNENLRTGEFVGWVYGECLPYILPRIAAITSTLTNTARRNFRRYTCVSNPLVSFYRRRLLQI